jgi:1,4-dihydroxy-2-naphthoate octaprenyltransferase
VAHAGANVINDYYDAISAATRQHRAPVPLHRRQPLHPERRALLRATGVFGYALLAAVIPAGLWLTAVSGRGLILIGLAGLVVGWAYSAPPLKLQSRGLGEFAITAGWLLVVVGSDFVQRRDFAFLPVAAGLGFALLVANVLYINQFPDVKADAGPASAPWWCASAPARRAGAMWLITALAYGWPLLMVLAGRLPLLALLSLLPAAASFAATRVLWAGAGKPAQLTPALKLTILSASTHGLLLAIVLVLPWSRPL